MLYSKTGAKGDQIDLSVSEKIEDIPCGNAFALSRRTKVLTRPFQPSGSRRLDNYQKRKTQLDKTRAGDFFFRSRYHQDIMHAQQTAATVKLDGR